jgi:alanyl-tRNA synthetase
MMSKVKMTSNELRQKFLEYFHAQKLSHAIVNSSSLVPYNDDTLLFTNAGMVQFKDVFLGLEKNPYTRAVSSQRCVRAGGKHNDLENVGYTTRHHTFFEMLGNFSFGDYFKEQAIQFAWDFLINYLKLPKEKLWITVYEKDDESEKIWHEKIGLPKERIIRCGEKDNFWSMGETGPCGPCSEIFYDHGESIWGGLPGTKDADGDRYIEIWNLVFMQYERHPDGSLTELPKPSVDTGMGLERISAVMQGVHNNYETDLFQPIIKVAKELYWETHSNTQTGLLNFEGGRLEVLADHIRSTSFLILDGVIPSNEGRGYVLRRIIRRAVRHGYQMGMESPFFHKLVEPLVVVMNDAYPELKKNQSLIQKTLEKEEMQFIRTLEQGIKILDQEIPHLPHKIIPGELVFKLYDTFGFPIDLTEDIAREKNLTVDRNGFEKEMDKQRKQSQSTQKFAQSQTQLVENLETLKSITNPGEFTGYEYVEEPNAVVTAVLENGIILDKTPFYAESGGQIGDQGTLHNTSRHAIFKVTDTQKLGQHIVHIGAVSSVAFQTGDKVLARINTEFRNAVMLNHTATHLLHAALRNILGKHVEQKGSLVAEDKLRFDFSHDKPVTREELKKIENSVNEIIRQNYAAEKNITTPEKAIQSGAMALFGEKYGDTIRTLKLGDYSYEVCGGTHVNRTGDIGLFKIVLETGIAAGIRRIEALTGQTALELVGKQQTMLEQLSSQLKVPLENVAEKIDNLLQQQKQLQKQIETLQSGQMRVQLENLLSQQKKIHHINFIAGTLENTDGKMLREASDYLKQKISSGVIVLGSAYQQKANIIVVVTKDLCETSKEYSANQLITAGAEKIGGKGGGRPDLAQAGGDKPENLHLAIEAIEKCL